MSLFKRDLPSFCLFTTYRLRYQLLSADKLSQLTEKVREAIGMKPLSPMVVDFLPSPIFGTNAVSVNQPLMTSVMSMDSWPEVKVVKITGAFMILVHSCQMFKEQEVHRAVKEFFPEVDILHREFRNNTCQGLAYWLTRTKLWFLDWHRERLRRRNLETQNVEPVAEIV